ncbi:MAG: hypothetical protein ACOY5W_00005, partial [Pseudomonadota bacterium]
MMMMRPLIAVFIGMAISYTPLAYELGTHARVTLNAYTESGLGSSQPNKLLMRELGIKFSDNPFGDRYYDMTTATIDEYGVSDTFELKHMPPDTKPLSVQGWLMRGAIREDDYRHDDFPCTITAPNPQDGVTVDRPVNHFYDPINDQSLGVGSAKAFDWALGTQNALTEAGNVPDAGRTNHYTVFDAREAMFRALTGMDKAGNKAIGVNGSTPTTPADKEAVRKAYWATTFRALGDLAHLVEDMAQPQHTRGDPHLTECADVVRAILGGKSLYEEYVEARATGAELFTPGGTTLELDPLPYNGYPVPRFNDYVSYFTTRHVQTGTDDATVLSRKGLADYSNRSFFTVRTNLNVASPRFDLPTSNYPSYGTHIVTTDLTGKRLPGNGVRLLTHEVVDSIDHPAQSRAGVPLTTLSTWDPWLEQQGLVVRYKLSIPNYEAMANLLIPRAVAYSAGLIDYFFRGRLEITPPDEGVYSLVDHAVVNGIDQGFTRLKLKLRNITPAINDGQAVHAQAMGPGTLYAVVKFRRNPCYQPDLSGEVQAGTLITDPAYCRTANEEIVVSDPMNVQNVNAADPQTMSFVFSDGPIPINATDVYLQIVYRGRLGSEADAVVVATRDISEPTYVSVT